VGVSVAEQTGLPGIEPCPYRIDDAELVGDYAADGAHLGGNGREVASLDDDGARLGPADGRGPVEKAPGPEPDGHQPSPGHPPLGQHFPRSFWANARP
jgi:hypothetical protein